MRPIRQIGGALLVLMVAGCEEPPTIEPLAPSKVPHFSIRGRRSTSSGEVPQLAVHIDATGSPLAPGVFRSSVVEAIGVWNETNLVQINVAQSGEPFEVLCAWRQLVHDECPSFGQDTTVAHSGPVSDSTFIHFDADREWTPDGSVGLPLIQIATHELGHVLGLGHSLDEGAVMHPNHDARRATPAPSDLAGLAALYGSLPQSSGDVFLRLPNDELTPILQRVAPGESTELAALDVNGNGRDELLLWRTDVEGLGYLMIYHFDEDRRLTLSEGPIIGCVVPEARTMLCQDVDGAGVLLSIRTSGHYSARRFEGTSNPRPIPPSVKLAFPTGYADADGDGVMDMMRADLRLSGVLQFDGDLDGDGQAEAYERVP
jgi:hypothetical protein